METLTFAGINGQVLESSPNGNYVTLQLSDRVTIVGTYSNEYGWDEMPDDDSGFCAFITYIGTDGSDVKGLFQWVRDHQGYYHQREACTRPSKRTNYPLEIKVRGLKPSAVIELMATFDNYQQAA